jgi:hypothetical protein
LPDHPESLFVPAFLKEATKAMEDPVPIGWDAIFSDAVLIKQYRIILAANTVTKLF